MSAKCLKISQYQLLLGIAAKRCLATRYVRLVRISFDDPASNHVALETASCHRNEGLRAAKMTCWKFILPMTQLRSRGLHCYKLQLPHRLIDLSMPLGTQTNQIQITTQARTTALPFPPLSATMAPRPRTTQYSHPRTAGRRSA